MRARVRGVGVLSLICVLSGAAKVGGSVNGAGGGSAAAEDVMLLPTQRQQPGLLASRQRPAFRVKRTPMVAVQRMSGGGDDLVTCRIEVQVQHTRPGDAVMLLGNNPVLHSWNKQEAIELTTTEADFPWWSAEVQLPAGEELEYKFAIRSAAGSWIWEPLPPGKNRQSVVPADCGATERPVLAFIYGSEVVVEPRQVAQDESEASEESSDVETSCVERAPGPVEKATGMLLGLLRSASPPRGPSRGRRQGQPASRSLSPAPELARQRSTTPDWVSSLGAVPQLVQSQKEAEIPTMHAERDSPADATATSTPAPAPSPAEPAPALSSDASEGSIFRFRSARAREGREVEKSLAPASVGGEEDAEALAVTEESVAAGMPEDAGRQKDTVVHLLRVITAPITLPIWILFQTGSITLTLMTRLYLTMHSVLFDADPAKFERILMRNVHFMDGSMRQMNSSLTAAISTVERQIGDINRLESMWHKEHEAYLAALEEKKLSETEFQATARHFCDELAAAKKAAAEADEAHAGQLRMARTELQDRLKCAEDSFHEDIERLQGALSESNGEVGRLERELREARDASRDALSEERKLTELEMRQASEKFKLAMEAVKKEAIESEERHAEELRAARAQLQSKMREAEDALRGDIARLESALNSSDSFMRDLARKLLEAQEMGRKTEDDITVLQRELNQSRSEATMLQHKLTATEEAIEKNKVMFAEQLKKVASDAQSEARVLAMDAATKVVAASAASEAVNLNPRLRTGVASKVPGSLPGKMKLQLKKASEGMPEALAAKGLASDLAVPASDLAVELDGSFVSEERDSAQDSPEKPRALNPLNEMLSRSVLASHALPSPEPADDDAALRSANAVPLSEGCFEEITERRGAKGTKDAPKVGTPLRSRAFVV